MAAVPLNQWPSLGDPVTSQARLILMEALSCILPIPCLVAKVTPDILFFSRKMLTHLCCVYLRYHMAELFSYFLHLFFYHGNIKGSSISIQPIFYNAMTFLETFKLNLYRSLALVAPSYCCSFSQNAEAISFKRSPVTVAFSFSIRYCNSNEAFPNSTQDGVRCLFTSGQVAPSIKGLE